MQHGRRALQNEGRIVARSMPFLNFHPQRVQQTKATFLSILRNRHILVSIFSFRGLDVTPQDNRVKWKLENYKKGIIKRVSERATYTINEYKTKVEIFVKLWDYSNQMLFYNFFLQVYGLHFNIGIQILNI